MGYTEQMHQAGFYELECAVNICLEANKGQRFGELPNEMMFPVAPRPAPIQRSCGSDNHKSPEQWCEKFGVMVLDPDGWDRASADWTSEWNRPLTQDQFIDKFQRSTKSITDRKKYLQYKHLFS